MEFNICPYPGLRPYTEEESIYFKGRDEHINEITSLLEDRKFLMVTGASGDGKSSLIYAGVIPYARAGLLKAKFNNWTIADLRPERDPLLNLTRALSKALNLDFDTVSQELQYGFSALIDLYKSSQFYEDFTSTEWKDASDQDVKLRKRKCGNLIILVDQFEEFFTNSENYSKGNPTDNAQNVINLLLETAKLAKSLDIPIYIICTMRSDYIGECAAFRNLPEFIGHSHFFVPRLKRQEIRQVIEEPAMLSGVEIDSGLIEILINTISDGFDQLPLLQHALHQVWVLAVQENNKMEIIHLAKIGGMKSDLLNDSDKKEYDIWFDEQDEFKKEYLEESGLGNVLNLHMNEIYHHHDSDEISDDERKILVRKVFQGLTKIDDGRGVRNRMNVDEIIGVIDSKSVGEKELGALIRPYRIEGSTFISPFIFNEKDEELNRNTILDITHESLLRNWDKLKLWSREESHDLLNYQDFKIQLERWKENDKSRGNLLPIGAYTHFSKWKETTSYNNSWVRKYEGENYDEEKTTLEISETETFLNKSKLKNWFSLLILNYGIEKILSAMLLIVALAITGFAVVDYSLKTDEQVLSEIDERSREIYDSKYVKGDVRSDFILLKEIESNSGIQLLNKLKDTIGIQTGFSMMMKCISRFDQDQYMFMDTLYGWLEHKVLVNQQLIYLNALINVDSYLIHQKYDFVDDSKRIIHLNKLKEVLEEEVKNGIVKDHGVFINSAILLSLNSHVLTDNLNSLARSISPFEKEGREFFEKNFSKTDYLKNRSWDGAPKYSHNGGYLLLNALYSSTSNSDQYSKSLDSLFEYSKKAFLGWGNTGWRFFTKIAITNGVDPMPIYKRLSLENNLSVEYYIIQRFDFENEARFNYNPIFNDSYWKSSFLKINTPYYDQKNLIKLFNYFKNVFSENEFTDDENYFYQAINYKMFSFESQNFSSKEERKRMLDSSYYYYQKISDVYLDTKFAGPDNKLSGDLVTARTIYYLPSFAPPMQTINLWRRTAFNKKKEELNHFVKYIMSKKEKFINKLTLQKEFTPILYSLIGTGNEIGYIPDTIVTEGAINQYLDYSNFLGLTYDTLTLKTYRLLNENNFKTALNSIDTSLFFNSEYLNGSLHNEGAVKQKLLKKVLLGLSELMDVSAYYHLIDENKKNEQEVFQLDRSISSKMIIESNTNLIKCLKRIKSTGQISYYMLKALGEMGYDDVAMRIIKNVPDAKKSYAVKFYMNGVLAKNNISTAQSLISDQASYETELILMNEIFRLKLLSGEGNEDWMKYLVPLDWKTINHMFPNDDGFFIY